MLDDVQTFRCPDCKDIILILLDPADFDEAEFNAKVASHAKKHEEFEKEFSLD